MKIFKFTSGGQPEIYMLTEGIRLSTPLDYVINYKQTVIEQLRLRSLAGSKYLHEVTEELILNNIIGWPEYLQETLGLSEDEFWQGWAYFVDNLNLTDAVSPTKVISISLEENIGFADSGDVSINLIDYIVTWRARSRSVLIGYGKAGYGIEQSYGDGPCNDLQSFRVKVIDLPQNTVKRNVVIPIVDKNNPDDDARYVYTAMMNLNDHNWTFKNSLKFEVYQIDIDGVESPAASIDIEPIPL